MIKDDVNIPTDMLEAINDCNKRCGEVVDKFSSKIDAQPARDIVYHYTDCTGLLGILESGKIRLTDIFGLNDPSELQHGVKYACEILKAKAQGGHQATKVFAKIFSGIVDGGLAASAFYCVACCSFCKDDLGQWRAYGDNGRGFIIGFDRKLFEKTFLKRDDEYFPVNIFFPVTYNDTLLHELQEQIVEVVFPLIVMPEGRKLSNAIIEKFLVELSTCLGVSIIQAAIFFKHEAYENEQEYRFLHTRGVDKSFDNLRHRAQRNFLIRFDEYDWNTNGQHVLREIVIGPATDEKSAKSFAQDCLRAGGFNPDRVIISKSKIPYRNS